MQEDQRIITRDGTSWQEKYCSSILLFMCTNSGAVVVGDLARDGSIIAVIYSMLMESSGRGDGASSKKNYGVSFNCAKDVSAEERVGRVFLSLNV